MIGKYPVINLCESTRFKERFLEAQKRLSIEGDIFIRAGLLGHSGDNEAWTEGTKIMLDSGHICYLNPDTNGTVFIPASTWLLTSPPLSAGMVSLQAKVPGSIRTGGDLSIT